MLAELELKAAVPAQHLPIYRLEAELLKQPQVECPVEHAFCSGLYARTMHIPAGTILTGQGPAYYSGIIAINTALQSITANLAAIDQS